VAVAAVAVVVQAAKRTAISDPREEDRVTGGGSRVVVVAARLKTAVIVTLWWERPTGLFCGGSIGVFRFLGGDYVGRMNLYNLIFRMVLLFYRKTKPKYI
jgi:hypothetical protein